MSSASSWFQRYLLPGFVFQAAVIAGGYATGRELVEFFLPAGSWGGLLGMMASMVVWSAVLMVSFLLARAGRASPLMAKSKPGNPGRETGGSREPATRYNSLSPVSVLSAS